MNKLSSLLVVSLVAVAACNNKAPEPTPGDKTGPASSAGPASPSSTTVTPSSAAVASASAPKAPAKPTDIAWDAPASWKEAPSAGGMRKATYKIAPAAGDAEGAEVSVSQAGGELDDNINRWAGQFGGATPTRTERTVNGLKVVIVELHGTYSAGGMMGKPQPPKTKYALLGAIVASEPWHFFKMWGPDKTVAAAKPDFDKLVGSVRGK